MKETNLKLKALLIEKYGTLTKAGRDLGMDEFRLSRIIHGRAEPQQIEKRRVAWKLQKPATLLFPGGNGNEKEAER
jgi:hypothetical protein